MYFCCGFVGFSFFHFYVVCPFIYCVFWMHQRLHYLLWGKQERMRHPWCSGLVVDSVGPKVQNVLALLYIKGKEYKDREGSQGLLFWISVDKRDPARQRKVGQREGQAFISKYMSQSEPHSSQSSYCFLDIPWSLAMSLCNLRTNIPDALKNRWSWPKHQEPSKGKTGVEQSKV